LINAPDKLIALPLVCHNLRKALELVGSHNIADLHQWGIAYWSPTFDGGHEHSRAPRHNVAHHLRANLRFYRFTMPKAPTA
jgi:hypothetical protein